MDVNTADETVLGLTRICDNIATSSEWITPVLEAISGVTAAEAAWKPAPDERSIWEITCHLLAWTDWAVHFLDSRDTDVTDWPPVVATEPGDWDAARRALADTLAAFRAKIAATRGDALFAAPTPEVTETSRFMGIASILVHNAYHAGQITKLHERYQAR
jgi:hypothetical protein